MLQTQEPICTDCGDTIDGASVSVTLHEGCCTHENVDGIERSGWALDRKSVV